MMVIAKICGEDTPPGMAEWGKHRGSPFKAWLKLERETMPHHSTYRRICETMLDVEVLAEILSVLFSEKRSFGQQVLVSMDGKVLRRTLDDEQKGTNLLAASLPGEGMALMEMAIDGKGSGIPGAAQLWFEPDPNPSARKRQFAQGF